MFKSLAPLAAPDDPAGIASTSSSLHRAAFTASMAKHLFAHRAVVKYLFSSSFIFSNQRRRHGYEANQFMALCDDALNY
ncbi:hypothetical protein [Nitrospirillum sp. BR 11163]|uniref:hypothetical protein n=1 Tax=Nitrospirillum sp. BR 11163 TaxID=3104323 RepID=UPI002AFE351E|nr:hypothetical protein [Nitrospirillum sp. BR 11163]MEA1675562.1 hypothetical protein [Nitrospirillum sp. BR 11163]